MDDGAAERDETDEYDGDWETYTQDTVERRAARVKYRSIITNLQENKTDLINPASDELQERLKEVDELYQPDQRAREGRLDSRAVELIANMGLFKAQSLHTDFVRFEPTEYAIKLARFVGAGGVEDGSMSGQGWAKLGKAAHPYFNRSPPFQYMLGAFERGPQVVRERKQRVPSEKDNTTAKGTVKEVNDFEKNDQGEETSQEVERVLEILRNLYYSSGEAPIDYFNFVLNPDSFGHTVENIFYVSFLVRDNIVMVYLDEDELPVIKPVDTAKKQKKEKEEVNMQTVVSITPVQWRSLVEAYGVTEPQIKPLKSNGHG